MVQILSWTLGIHSPKLFSTREDMGKQSGRAFNALLSPTNLTVLCDHRPPDGISSVDSIPIRDFLGPCALMSSLQVLDGLFKEGISMGRFTQGTT
jgi:hypothetical protein